MQSACFSAALPYADMFPALAGDKVFERVAQGLAEALFGMQRIRKRERAKETPFLQIRFLGKSDFSANGICLFTFIGPLDVFFPLLLVGDRLFHGFPHIGFALFTRQLLAFLIGGFKLFLKLHFNSAYKLKDIILNTFANALLDEIEKLMKEDQNSTP